MSIKRRLLLAFWAFHLTLCLLSAAPDFLHIAHSRTWSFIAPYGAYTGATNKYGFFAPNVPSARRVRARVLCDEEWIPVEMPLQSMESRLRLTTITSLLMYKEIEEPVAASWGAYAFGNFPCAKAALVEVDYYEVPPMKDYRQGKRPDWEVLKVFSFTTEDILKSLRKPPR
jgi:hypothetical protein